MSYVATVPIVAFNSNTCPPLFTVPVKLILPATPVSFEFNISFTSAVAVSNKISSPSSVPAAAVWFNNNESPASVDEPSVPFKSILSNAPNPAVVEVAVVSPWKVDVPDTVSPATVNEPLSFSFAFVIASSAIFAVWTVVAVPNRFAKFLALLISLSFSFIYNETILMQ